MVTSADWGRITLPYDKKLQACQAAVRSFFRRQSGRPPRTAVRPRLCASLAALRIRVLAARLALKQQLRAALRFL